MIDCKIHITILSILLYSVYRFAKDGGIYLKLKGYGN